MDVDNVLGPGIFGLVVFIAGVWQLISFVKYFNSAASHKIRQRNFHIDFSLWLSLAFGLIIAAIGLSTLISAVQAYLK
ncbi:hypothetical protein [Lapidilactobacillus wuchangensis]|uniref:hypothetical protein n=1 Tax=Lapidilactobacillus wuchangensis TaxID=2486001 RepID=UPI000F7AB320|nr:hypothetical protein [Lapidilactobacillus wuchangensis]